MSNAEAHWEVIRRKRITEERVRSLDASDIVDWINDLEDQMSDLVVEIRDLEIQLEGKSL